MIMQEKMDLLSAQLEEEKLYYELLKKETSPYEKECESFLARERLLEEMERIHRNNHSKSFLLVHRLISYIKKQGEPFYIRGSAAPLYLSYLLEDAKFNPVEIGCPYQEGLGSGAYPKEPFATTIFVAGDFAKKLKEHFEALPEEYGSFYWAFPRFLDSIPDAKDWNHPYRILIPPKGGDIEERFRLKSREGDKFPFLIEKEMGHGNPFCAMIEIRTDCRLDLYKPLQKRHGLVDPLDGIPLYKSLKEEGKVEVVEGTKHHGFRPELNGYSLNNIIDDFSFARASYHSAGRSPRSLRFPDRDSVFDYFHDHIGLGEELSYSLMEEVRKGLFHRHHADMELPEPEKEDLMDIAYLWPRSAVAEFVYYFLQLAQYFRKDEESYQILMDECRRWRNPNERR